MSHLYGLTFFRNGKEHFSTEMRAEEHPNEAARSYVSTEQSEGNPAGVLVVKYMQTGIDLELLSIADILNRLGREDPATQLALAREREKTELRARQNESRRGEHKPPSSRPAVFTTQKGGGIRKSAAGKKSQTLHGAAARDAILIEFGTGKNKRLVPLEDAQRMASQLESASRGSARTHRTPPRRSPPPSTVGGVLDRVKARKPIQPCRPKFTTGVIEVTPFVQGIASQAEVRRALARFEGCDWGDVSSTLVRRNNAATRKRQGELRGRYQSTRGVFVILSRLSRSGNAQTFIALPEEVD